MKYMGSKSRIKKGLLLIIQKIIKDYKITNYIEPFVGGANVIDDVICTEKIGGDNNEVLIELLKYVKAGGELPDLIDKELYSDVRKNKNTNKYPKWYIGAVGFLASYNGRYFDGGYAKPVVSKTGVYRDYYNEAKRNLEKQSVKFKDINFSYGDYTQFSNLTNSLIYCDIPYANTKQFSTSKNFDYEKFWNWARKMSENNIVLISEHSAPKDFVCIWEQEVTRTQNNKDRQIATEKLFTINNLNL